MQYSPPIPFIEATQNNVKHPNDLKPGTEFVRLTMFTGERDPVPSWPWPTYTWPATIHGSIPAYGGVTPGGHDWLWLGGYLVIIGQTTNGYAGQLTGDNVLAWPALSIPSTITGTHYPDGIHGLTNTVYPNAWDVYYTITTYLYPNGFSHASVDLLNTYYTGAGSETLADVTKLYFGIPNGPTAVLFDDAGIGLLSLTGDWNQPFDFTRRVHNFITASWPLNVNGWVYFVDEGGKMFRTDGSYAIEVGGGYFPGVQTSTALFNVNMIPEVVGGTDSTSHHLITWPDIANNAWNRMQFDGDLHRLVVDICYYDGSVKSAGTALVGINSGSFQFLPDATNLDNGTDLALPRVETGGIKLGQPSDRTHVAYVDVDFEIVGDPTALTSTPGSSVAFTTQGNSAQRLTGPGGVWMTVNPADVSIGAPGTINALSPMYWVNGTSVTYSAGPGPALGGLVDGQTYYIVGTGPYYQTSFELSATCTITSGTSLTVAATEAFTGTMVDGPPSYILASGRQVVRCWVNKLVSRIPRFRITVNNPPAGIKVRLWGISRVAFDQGGLLP